LQHQTECRDAGKALLSAIIAIVSEYIKRGCPRTDERRHRFREWTQSLDWIIQEIFKMPPLMDDHIDLQKMASDAKQGFLRQWAENILDRNRGGISFRAQEISEHAYEFNLEIPECPSAADPATRARQIGNVFKPIFDNIAPNENKGRMFEVGDLIVWRHDMRKIGIGHDEKYYTAQRRNGSMPPEPDIGASRCQEARDDEKRMSLTFNLPSAPEA
jgi:hypothetical protein